MKYIALSLLTLSLLLPVTAFALENLRFKQAKSYKQVQMIDFIINHTENTEIPYLLAEIDLNGDAINEYVIKPESKTYCPALPLCPYYVTAFQEHEPIIIGKFNAHKMLISDKKTYGIRQIIVYNVPHNDFTSKTASWNPYSFSYGAP